MLEVARIKPYYAARLLSGLNFGYCPKFEMGFESPIFRVELLDGVARNCPALKRIVKRDTFSER